MSLLGGLAGLAQGYTDVVNRNEDQWAKDDLIKQEQAAEIAKEQRIREANKQDTQETFDFNTNPANVKKSAEAEALKADILAKQKYSHNQDEAEREGLIARSKQPGMTQTEIDKAQAEIDLKRAQIADKKKETELRGTAPPDPYYQENKTNRQLKNKELELKITQAINSDNKLSSEDAKTLLSDARKQRDRIVEFQNSLDPNDPNDKESYDAAQGQLQKYNNAIDMIYSNTFSKGNASSDPAGLMSSEPSATEKPMKQPAPVTKKEPTKSIVSAPAEPTKETQLERTKRIATEYAAKHPLDTETVASSLTEDQKAVFNRFNDATKREFAAASKAKQLQIIQRYLQDEEIKAQRKRKALIRQR